MKKNTKFLISLVFILTFSIVLISTIRKFTLAADTNISSETYNIENEYITNISPKTSISLYKKYFNIENGYLRVMDDNNGEITSGYIYTGSKTALFNNNHTMIKTYINIITGDVNKDGEVDNNDLTISAKHLVNNSFKNDYLIKALDINKDNQTRINDLTLLEKYLNSSYESLSLNTDNITLMTGEKKRIIPTIKPSIILNQNLNWQTNNNNVSVDDSGLITANSEGSTMITVSTKDESLAKSIRVNVDNTPLLETNTISIYRGGNPTRINIKAVDYNDLTCSSANENIATCELNNKDLIVKSVSDGNTKITVTSPTYGSVELNVEVIFTYFSLFPKTWCIRYRQSMAGATITGYNFGAFSVKNISDRDMIWNATISRYGISMESGYKTGDAIITFTESNGNNDVNFTAKVYKLELEKQSGTTNPTTPVNIEILSENAGNLTCTSTNNEIATCSINNNNLIINPISVGQATITVTGDKCGQTSYSLNVTDNTEVEP